MIDIHCHILPGVDDGAKTLAESLAMAQRAASQGIHTIIATPHYRNGIYQNIGGNIIGAVEYLNGKLQQEQIPVKVLPGQETRIYGEMVRDLERGIALPLKGERKGYVLIDLPSDSVPQYTTQLLFDMQIAGYRPIIAHPERNGGLMNNPDKLYRMVKNGAFTQVTAAGLIGVMGSKVQKSAKQLLEANLAHFVASDAHNVKKRGFYMREAFQYIRKHFGNLIAYQLMENSESLIRGKSILADEPVRIKGERMWGFVRN